MALWAAGASKLRQEGGLNLDLDSLAQLRAPVMERVQGVLAGRLGLGANMQQMLALRKCLNKPGAPFAGLGFFKWNPDLEAAVPDSEVSAGKGAEFEIGPCVAERKVREFERCADGDADSIYFWGLQPIFSADDRAVGVEVLVRAKNGADAAPFEDVQALMDPAAPHAIRSVYARWKGTEVVDWPLRLLKAHPVLQRLDFICVNLRPLDLSPESLVFQEVVNRLWALTDSDRMLLLRTVCIEVTEDQEHPHDIGASLRVWQELGFRCAFDDAMSELVLDALGKRQRTSESAAHFHTTVALAPLLTHFWLVKVDMDWAGHMLFLSHPCLGKQGAPRRAEVLRRVRDEGLVYVAQGPSGLRNTNVRHAQLLTEFAAWARQVILRRKHICIELTVRRDDENCMVALEGLQELGVDILGTHASHFCFQGGLTGPKAFDPQQLAAHVMVSPCDFAPVGIDDVHS